MARTMKWPPVPVGGRIPFVEGVDATVILVTQLLSDLQTNPFNDALLSLGDITFRISSQARVRIENALNNLRRIISVESVTQDVDEDGNATYTVRFVDREARVASEVVVNG